MPHFGLMDGDELGPVEGPRMRARLHIRGGKRRMRQGKLADGIATLYDALVSAMQYFLADPSHVPKVIILPEDNLLDDKNLFAILVRSQVIRHSFDFDAFNRLMEESLESDVKEGSIPRELLDDLDEIFTDLTIMPFDDNDLPPEDLNTF